MLRIGLKLWSINTDAYLREAQRLYAEGVFDYLELFVVPGTLDRLPLWQKVEIPFVLHHAHSAVGFNPAVQELFASNERIVTETLYYAEGLNPGFIIFHAGSDGTIQESARQLQYFKEKYLAEWPLLVENKPYKPLPNKLGTVSCRGSDEGELAVLVSALKSGFCLDFGHAVASANTHRVDPYAFIEALNKRFNPSMFHLSDVCDMSSELDAHPHLGMGCLDISRLMNTVLRSDSMISIETTKTCIDRLDDFVQDVRLLKSIETRGGQDAR